MLRVAPPHVSSVRPSTYRPNMTLVITSSQEEHGTIHGDVIVQDGGDLILHGMIVGTLTVGVGGHAHVFGTVQRLVVRDAGGAVLDGTCTGDVRNVGGDLTIRGTVAGTVTGHSH